MNKPLSCEDLVRQTHRLSRVITRLEEQIEVLKEEVEGCFDQDVTCVFCSREVPESRAVSPAGQGIWFCNVCDDELTRDRARYLIKKLDAKPYSKRSEKGGRMGQVRRG